ncbi:MAG: hypothetical protein ACHP7M_02650 [Burkholderiales bacterium]|jgi:uncharacterized protein YcfL
MKLIVTLVAAVVLGGCSSLPMQKAENSQRVVCDSAQMEAVDRIARAQRTEVHWVNCPQLSPERAKSVS